ncbi:phenylalanine--tRNA ligase subunit alpha [Candidatus Liberibacter asiaticus]|uniref:Phenylalanine--tRNA ligase alpha subunit n=4 Tax=Liberibacter asiaticus TaxID=34021 RepID=C6XHP7_LIBAP|nr:phenylalanyl-tRNA synthetase, alpha subunit [Candidatus Liberibacter asiaticus str. psy62]AGH16557.1 phenylalanyl-tRNA synthetase subunit alpha [Candidatus Liberibacter asiaticus str. gxpsy]ALK07752.2 phenylalanine--tRNA ligase subunit alpha [Candidatus Liberibacter asiaticus]BAP26075.1 phenylalanyl-tRNA synthetase subunit alpha [Candidatus Liberibacter asiaticus str. Ishi-1]ASK52421.1 phenylalanine--tRNA ligase subunit alpha [Candidatus Liberibacter asiaticus]
MTECNVFEDEVERIRSSLYNSIASVTDMDSLNAIRVATLGRKGSISSLLKDLKNLDSQQVSARGAILNQLKVDISGKISARKDFIRNQLIFEQISSQSVDVSLPVFSSPCHRGRIHPVTQVIDEVTCIFMDMGFALEEGSDIETDYYNFAALNFPDDHPARQMHDTFFVPGIAGGKHKLLRTHTSPVQIRVMESQDLPIKVIVPGKTYRRDSDSTHSPMFHQIEGLVVSDSATIANLRWVLESFCKSFFEVSSLQMRFRPSFFPFTEPSFEVDVRCSFSDGIIKFDEGTEWMEILGCGMVDPRVLRGVGIDPDIYQGFAWGMGLDRIAMLKYGMPDVREFFGADVRWIEHYGFSPLDIPPLFSRLA